VGLPYMKWFYVLALGLGACLGAGSETAPQKGCRDFRDEQTKDIGLSHETTPIWGVLSYMTCQGRMLLGE
jgi:hypothetical protein